MIKVLLRLRFAGLVSSFRLRGKDHTKPMSTGKIVLMVFLLLYLVGAFFIMFGGIFLGLAGIYFPLGYDWMYFSMFALFSLALQLIGSIFSTKSQIFDAKDNETLLSMPIPPRDIFISRLLSVMLLDYALELLVAIPAGVAWAILGNGGILVGLFFVVAVVFLPLLAVAVSCLFAWILSVITSRIRKKALVTTLISLVFLFAYFYFCFNMDSYMTALMESGTEFADSFRAVLPLYWIGAGIGDANGLCLLFTVAICVIPFVFAVFVLSKTFLRLTVSKGNKEIRKGAKVGAAKVGSLKGALLRREFSHFFSSSTYLLNGGLSVPLCIGVTILLLVKGQGFATALAELEAPISAGDLICAAGTAVILFLNFMALITAPSVSIEGKNISLLCSMPIPTKAIFGAKIGLQLWIMMPTNLLCGILLIAFYRPSVVMALILLIIPALFAVWCAIVGLLCNLFHPVFDWVNEAQPIKQGVSILLSMLFNFLPAIALIAVGVVCAFFSLWLSLAACTLLILAGDALLLLLLNTVGVRRWETLS